MEVSNTRKDVLLFIFLVIMISSQVAIISNIIYGELYNVNNKILFISILITLLMITIYVIITLMFRNNYSKYSITLKCVYNIKQNKFMDIYCLPSTVNSRLLFNNLNENAKEKIMFQDFYKMPKSKFKDFCNCIAVQIIFSRILHTHKKYSNYIEIDHIKELLVKFRYLNIDSILGTDRLVDGITYSSRLQLPKGFMIKKVEDEYLKLESNYGFVNFDWKAIISSKCDRSIHLLNNFEKKDISNCCEVSIKLNMNYGYKPMRLFTNLTEELEEFIEMCKHNMNEFDANTGINNFNLESMPKTLLFIEQIIKESVSKVNNSGNKDNEDNDEALHIRPVSNELENIPMKTKMCQR